MLDRVLDALAARPDHARLARRVVGVDQPRLGRDLRAHVDLHEPLRARDAHPDPEPLVGLLEDDDVLRRGRAHLVAPHAPGPPRVVDRRVEHVPPVRGEDGARERPRDLVHEVGAGLQVADPQRVALVAHDVDRVREPRPVGRDVERPEREELVALGLDVVVEEHLLARHGHARLQHGRHPGRRRVAAEARVDRGAGPDRVLRPLDRARVVPVRALAHRDGQVRLERAGLDLLEDPLAQRLEVREARLGVRVLGLEVRDDLGRLLVPQPLVVVVDRLAVVRARRGTTGGDGRLRRLGRLGHLGLGRRRRGGLREVVGHLARVVPQPDDISA